MLNPNIILQGANPDLNASFGRGMQNGANMGALQRQGQLNSLFRAQGPQIMAGDQNALNALSRFDPNAALGVQGARQDMAAQQQRMDILSREEQRQIEAFATQADAAEVAEKAAKIEQGIAAIAPLALAGDLQGANMRLAEFGLPPVNSIEELKFVLVQHDQAYEIMKRGMEMQPKPQGPQSPQGKLAADLEAGLITSEQFNAANQPRGPLVNIEGNAAPDPFQQKLAGAEADMFVSFLENGPAATRNIARLDQLEGLLENVPTGLGTAFKARLGEIGIPIEGLSEIQAAQALINQMVPEQRQPGSGPMSDADLALFKQSVPRLINQPGGNNLIIQTIRQINEYDARLASIAQQAASGQIDRPQARQMINAMQNPLDGFSSRIGGVSRDTRQEAPPAPPAPAGANITETDWQRAWERMSPEDRALFQ